MMTCAALLPPPLRGRVGVGDPARCRAVSFLTGSKADLTEPIRCLPLISSAACRKSRRWGRVSSPAVAMQSHAVLARPLQRAQQTAREAGGGDALNRAERGAGMKRRDFLKGTTAAAAGAV